MTLTANVSVSHERMSQLVMRVSHLRHQKLVQSAKPFTKPIKSTQLIFDLTKIEQQWSCATHTNPWSIYPGIPRFFYRHQAQYSLKTCHDMPEPGWYQSNTLGWFRSGSSTLRHIDGSVQERRNSIANALELHLSCTNPSIFTGAVAFT